MNHRVDRHAAAEGRARAAGSRMSPSITSKRSPASAAGPSRPARRSALAESVGKIIQAPPAGQACQQHQKRCDCRLKARSPGDQQVAHAGLHNTLSLTSDCRSPCCLSKAVAI